MPKKKDRNRKNRKNFNPQKKMEENENLAEVTQKKLADIKKNRDEKLARIDQKFNNSQETVQDIQNTQPEPVELDILENEDINTIQPENVMEEVEISDDVNTALINVFKEVIRSPNAVPGKVIPFAQVLLKKRIIDLKNIDPKIVTNTMDRFKNIWEAFDLSETDDMLFLNDVINNEIALLTDVQREIDINVKALEVLNDINTIVAKNRKQFGAGLL